MTNTLIMEILRNKAINQKTKKALFIAIGSITILGIGFYIYQENQEKKYNALNRKHTNLVNLTNARDLDLSQIVAEKDNKIEEQKAALEQLQSENNILSNNKKIQATKNANESTRL